jgi:hypothetical protein
VRRTPGTATDDRRRDERAIAAAAKANYGGTITFALENDVSNLDPMLSGLFVDRNIHYAMYDSLVRVVAEGRDHPVARQEVDVRRPTER